MAETTSFKKRDSRVTPRTLSRAKELNSVHIRICLPVRSTDRYQLSHQCTEISCRTTLWPPLTNLVFDFFFHRQRSPLHLSPRWPRSGANSDCGHEFKSKQIKDRGRAFVHALAVVIV